MQDTILIVPPFPYSIADDIANATSLGRLLVCTRPALLRPSGGRQSKTPSYKVGPASDDLLFNLAFFSTFEELDLPIHGPMEKAGVLKLYEPSPTPCLYVAPVDHMLGRVPLNPLFLAGNSTPEIPHKFSRHSDSDFPVGCADSAAADGRRVSNLYEVNQWLWKFGQN